MTFGNPLFSALFYFSALIILKNDIKYFDILIFHDYKMITKWLQNDYIKVAL